MPDLNLDARVTIERLINLAAEITTGLADGYQMPDQWTLTTLIAWAAGLGLGGGDIARVPRSSGGSASKPDRQRRGDDTRAYIDNIRSYLPAEDNEKEGP